MSSRQTLAVVLLSGLLTVTLFGATVATGVERTALDDQYIGETFEDENVSSEIGSTLRVDIATEVERSDRQQQVPIGVSSELDGERVANRAVTDEFISTELDRNIKISIGYLRGNAERFDLRTDLREIKAVIRRAVINGTTINTPELVGANTDQINAERVALLNQSEQDYRDARLSLTAEERTEIENEMETNVRGQLSNDSGNLTAAVLAHQELVLDGLTGKLLYEEYVAQLAVDKQVIRAVIADIALVEVPDEQSLFGEDEDPESALEPVRTGVGLTVTFAWLLPLLAVGLVGAVYATTRSTDRTAAVTGVGLVASGILGAVLGVVAAPALKGAIGLGGEDPDPIITGLIAVIDGTFRTVSVQSLVLAVAGVGILVVVIGDRRGLFDGLRDQLDLDSRADHQ